MDDDGCFYDHVPAFAGKHVYKVNDEVADALAAAGRLLARGKLVHSYPHSWRSKAPLIFRNTRQWFISMETTGLRGTALDAIDRVRWVPPAGRARIRSMIETRPDWVLSRQRVWGVPITVFVSREDGTPLRDAQVVERIAEVVEAEGADAWFTSDKARFLAPEHDPDAYDKVTDILDVWFESGTTHSFVLEKRPELMWPASLYLEGSDQHRGWFHSSLLESCGTRGRAPYDAVLTHGFVVDGEGRKMSKSLGNVIAPQQVNERYGADILRLWVVSTDYSEDLRISDEILRHQVDSYRRLRNTLRYLLGNLADFHAGERLPASEMPALERWVLHRLHGLDRDVRRWCEDFAFHEMFVALHHFCAVDLSAFYFDIRKDTLYCDSVDSPRRRAVRTVLDALFDCLTAWLAPFICFTAEEAWLARYPDDESVHLRVFPALPEDWRDDALAERMERTRAVRRVVTKALEQARAAKEIGSSLEAAPTVFVHERYRDALAYEDDDCATLFITSDATDRAVARRARPRQSRDPAGGARGRRAIRAGGAREVRALLAAPAGCRQRRAPPRSVRALRERRGRGAPGGCLAARAPPRTASRSGHRRRGPGQQVGRPRRAVGSAPAHRGHVVLQPGSGPEQGHQLRPVPERRRRHVDDRGPRARHLCRARRLAVPHAAALAGVCARPRHRRRDRQRDRPRAPWLGHRLPRFPRRRLSLACVQCRRLGDHRGRGHAGGAQLLDEAAQRA